jgi:hypothetical protein
MPELINGIPDVFVEKNGLVFRLSALRRYDPTTIALGFLGMGVASMAFSAYSTLEEGKEAAKLGKIAQMQYNAEAEAAREAGQYESREKRKEAQRFRAKQIARMYANGGLLTGSNLTILADTAAEFEMDAVLIQHGYDVEAVRLRNQGSLAAYQGRLTRRASRMRAFGMGMSGAANIGAMYYAGQFGSTKSRVTPKSSTYGGRKLTSSQFSKAKGYADQWYNKGI